MSFLKIERAIIRLSGMIALIGLAGLLALAFATILDISMRWLFNSPITGVRDASSLFLAVIIVSCLPACIAERGNITIRFLGNTLGPRWRYSFEVFGHLVMLMVFIMMAWQLWRYAKDLALNRETTWVLGWSVAPWWRGVSILVALCVPIIVFIIIKMLKLAITCNSAQENKIVPDKYDLENS